MKLFSSIPRWFGRTPDTQAKLRALRRLHTLVVEISTEPPRGFKKDQSVNPGYLRGRGEVKTEILVLIEEEINRIEVNT